MRYLWLLGCAGLAWAQGTQPKAKAEDYEVSGAAGAATVGAEYMVHSFSMDGKTFLAGDFLVVEAALFPRSGKDVSAAMGDFTLRVDGRVIRTAAPTQVVQSLERRGWTRQRGVEGVIGVGDTAVILGPPQQPPYGPAGTGRRPPRAPEPDYRANVPPGEEVKATDAVTKTALPEGVFAGAVSGFLYFPYRGNASRIRTVDLLYNGATLKLK